MNPLAIPSARSCSSASPLVSFLVAVMFAGASARAQGQIASIDSIFSGITAETPGCAVGVSQRGEVIVSRAYGLADVDRRVPSSPSPFLNIGSV